MAKTKTSRYDVAEHLRTPEEMAAYLEACLEEANGDAAFIAKALGDIARAKGMSHKLRVTQVYPTKDFTKHSLGNEAQVSTQSLKLLPHLA
jgi:probable addiction module antidote protein